MKLEVVQSVTKTNMAAYNRLVIGILIAGALGFSLVYNKPTGLQYAALSIFLLFAMALIWKSIVDITKKKEETAKIIIDNVVAFREII